MTACPALWAPPGIIAPRFGSWWRLPHFLTAGKAQRNNSTGKFKRNDSTGKIRRNSATVSTCCCGPGPCCDPSTVTASITGLAGCSCKAFSASLWFNVSGDPNGTFTLTRAGACHFHYIYPTGTCAFKVYTDSSCTSLAETNSITITAQWFTSNLLEIAIVGQGGFSGGKYLFDSVVAPANCVDPYSGAANLAPSDCVGGYYGYGGTVDVTLNY